MKLMKRISRKLAAVVNLPRPAPVPLDEGMLLDEPFHGAVEVNHDPVVTICRVDSVMPGIAVSTPMGDEIVHPSECEEPTRIYPPDFLASVQAAACMHRHETVPAMQAVKVA